jgi:cell division septum initiation protein DivIVA
MNSKIEQTIEELEQYIDSCKPQAFSSNKIIVNKDQIEELLTELRLRTPEEIKRYQKMISNKEAILADAQSKADAIIAQAEVTHSELVSEHQIMQQAYAQANEVVMIATKQAQEILDNATNDANNIRMGAIGYTDDLLKNLESILSNAIEGSKARYDNLISGLSSSLQVVLANRAELMPATEPELSEMESAPEQSQEEASSDSDTE